MALSRSVYTGISGLRNHQIFLDVVGNNIANVNTIGFKGGRITFEEVFAIQLQGASRPPGTAGGVNPMQLGLGSSIGSIDTLFSQGSMEGSGVVTDLAIQGEGFFIVKQGDTRSYTRSGAFQFDSGGRLVNPNNGAVVQGQLADAAGNIKTGSEISGIVLPFGQKSPAKATTAVEFTGNLDAGAIPDATILRSKQIYAAELSGQNVEGGDSDVNGLLAYNAAGNYTTLVEGITANTTTVTISDGVDRNSDGVIDSDDNFNFTYVASDTASPYDFNSLQDLVDGIDEVMGTTGTNTISATLSDNGQIQFTRLDLTTQLVVTSTNGLLQKALESANNRDAATAASLTDQFSHVATADDLLTNLRDATGQSLGLTDTDVITIDGKVGGVNIVTNLTLNVTATTTVNDFTEQVRQAFNITTGSVEINTEEGGAMVVTADGGLSYEITSPNIQATDSGGTTSRTAFDAIFDSTPNNWFEEQSAADVEVYASATAYDSLGHEHVLTLTFQKDVKTIGKWLWSTAVGGNAAASGGDSGYVTFKNDGSLSQFVYDGAATSFQFDPGTGAVNPVNVTISIGESGSYAGVTQLGADSSLVASDQDGYALGELDSISIDNYGNISGTFTNGVNQVMGRVMLAAFNNPSGLFRVGDNNFQPSANSGTPIFGPAVTSIQAEIVSGALEQSNVDLAQEFTNLIIAQKGFQASARVITVSDQFLSEVVELKR
ncbi:flagellar hook-basal body complex protein [candidate division KSB1 bacterium]